MELCCDVFDSKVVYQLGYWDVNRSDSNSVCLRIVFDVIESFVVFYHVVFEAQFQVSLDVILGTFQVFQVLMVALRVEAQLGECLPIQFDPFVCFEVAFEAHRIKVERSTGE